MTPTCTVYQLRSTYKALITRCSPSLTIINSFVTDLTDTVCQLDPKIINWTMLNPRVRKLTILW